MKRISPQTWRWFLLPLIITVGAIFAALCLPGLPIWIEMTLFGAFLLGLLFFLVTMIVWFARKQWRAGWGALGCLLVSLGSIIPAGALGFMVHLGSELEGADDFAVDLSLPEGVDLEEPIEMPPAPSRPGPDGWDPFQRALRKSLEIPGTPDPTITPSIPSLAELHRDHPELLKHYLAVHPAWWYHEYRGAAFATRRWKVDGRWHHDLHGYYSSFFPEPSMDR